ncbi:MBL fold metallo-hydrolase [Aquimarina sp. MMG015]|uniref:MBL fold metallo-hydrolase n=1 Tax=Aquimarina TaxID=290174 RepID=UPI0003F6E7DB|nr:MULTISPECIES: MBL fold metallo-hydrolase [Aquimarina]AXT55283.1 MBL fold metallo-hydrolase [Aquimarina sp. AD1]MBQ4802250.1 MBL fold metallo-hydrolase [Aquimarina sp. MMG015]RKN15844.1 MBL fold metallo-hydrolase [Aquimarina sp. AD1]
MKTYTLGIFALSIFLISCKSNVKEEKTANTDEANAKEESIKKPISDLKIIPISHATAVLEYKDNIIYIDPTGGIKAFENQKTPSIILITDIHGDHMNIETLNSLDISKSKIVVPQAVAEKLPANYTKQLVIINNGEVKEVNGISIEAIPMYNLREEALKFHNKGRGNGYVITLGEERLYFSGDTEDIPEMRALKDIDKAFVCMNLPYTMTVESAADAVLEFKPKEIYPYHYRGTDGFSDVVKFKEIVTKGNSEIAVVQLNWYSK